MWGTLKNINENKASLDGFPTRFLQTCRTMVQEDLMKMFHSLRYPQFF